MITFILIPQDIKAKFFDKIRPTGGERKARPGCPIAVLSDHCLLGYFNDHRAISHLPVIVNSDTHASRRSGNQFNS